MTSIIILFCSILCGFLIGKHFQKRQMFRNQFFADLTKYILLLKANVATSRIEVPTFNKEFSKSSSAVFASFLSNYNDLSYISKQQKTLVVSFVESLKTTTSAQLINNLDYYYQLVNAEYSLITNSARNSFACVKLGILMGVMVGILLM